MSINNNTPLYENAAAIIVAGGSGTRFQSALAKQYLRLGDDLVISHAISPLAAMRFVVVVGKPPNEAIKQELTRKFPNIIWTDGGTRRQDSVRHGLAALALAAKQRPPQFVFIHDAARPFLSTTLVDDLLSQLASGDQAVAPALAVADALKSANALSDGKVMLEHDLDRRGLYGVQTPQAFDFSVITAAHQAALETLLGNISDGAGFDDDIGLAKAMGHSVTLIKGERQNIKITYPEDLLWAQTWLMGLNAKKGQTMTTAAQDSQIINGLRIGHGYDIHGLIDHPTSDNDDNQEHFLTLGGVKIPYHQRLKGHSDADCLLHALTDALLGALALGDIGEHFPPNEERWRGADSSLFLLHALGLMRENGGKLINIDANIHCEAPRLKPWKPLIRQKLAELTGLGLDHISVKARTNEGFDAIGQKQAIAATVTILLQRTV